MNPYSINLPTNQAGYGGLEQQVRHMNTPSGVQNPTQAVQAPNPAQVWTGSGYQNFAPIRASDITFNPTENRRQVGGWGDYSGPEQWETTTSYMPNIANQTQYGFPDMMNQSNYEFTGGEDENSFSMRVKSGDKQGTRIKYVRQGDHFVPQIMGAEHWDTNNSGQNAALASVLGGAALGVAGAYGALGSGVESAFAGAAPNASLGWAYGGAIPGMEAGAGVAGGVAGQMMGPPTSAANPGVPGAASSSAPGGSFGGSEELFLQNSSLGPGARAGVGGGAGAVGGIPAGPGTTGNMFSGVRNFLGSPGGRLLGRFGSALYGSDARGDYAKDLQSIHNQMRGDADPYLKKLLESYQDPNAYFNTPDVKARLELEANKLMGVDSSRGRLSNPIERDMLLQKYAAKDIGEYRSGLRGALDKTYNQQLLAQLLAGWSQNNNTRNSGLFGMLGAGGDWLNGIDDIVKGGKSLWDDVISGWWDNV